MRKFLLICFVISFLAYGSSLAAQGILAPDVFPTYVNLNGITPVALGFICTTSSGGMSPLGTYQDAALTIPNQNPLRLNAAGQPVNGSALVSIFLQQSPYRFTLFAAGTGNTCNGVTVGSLVRQVDAVAAGPPLANGGSGLANYVAFWTNSTTIGGSVGLQFLGDTNTAINSDGNVMIKTVNAATSYFGPQLSFVGNAVDGAIIFASLSGRKSGTSPSDSGELKIAASNNGGTSQEVATVSGLYRTLIVGNGYGCSSLTSCGGPVLTAIPTANLNIPGTVSDGGNGGVIQIAGNADVGNWANIPPDALGNAAWTAISYQNNFRTYEVGDKASTVDVAYHFTDNTPSAQEAVRQGAYKSGGFYGANNSYSAGWRVYTLGCDSWTVPCSGAVGPVSEKFRITPHGSGCFGCGIAGISTQTDDNSGQPTFPLALLSVFDVNQATNSFGNLNVMTTDTAGNNKGGQITLGGKAADGYVNFATIAGRATNVAGDQGYLAFGTSNNGGTNAEKVRFDSLGNTIFNMTGSLIAQNATFGWMYIPGVATGKPNGSPAIAQTGAYPFVYDTVDNYLCIWNGSAWKCTTALTN